MERHLGGILAGKLDFESKNHVWLGIWPNFFGGEVFVPLGRWILKTDLGMFGLLMLEIYIDLSETWKPIFAAEQWVDSGPFFQVTTRVRRG